MNKAIFLDKDGTLINDIPYNVDVDKITLTSYAREGLRKLKANDFLLIGITNQSGIARGFFEEDALKSVFLKIDALLKPANVKLDAWYYCPHHPEGKVETYSIQCSCRKPLPGLIHEAATKFNVSLNESWMIGDILNDVEAGTRAGCNTVLIDNGNETEWIFNDYRRPTHTAKNLNEAATFILEEQYV